MNFNNNQNGTKLLPDFLAAITLPSSLSNVKFNFYEIPWHLFPQEETLLPTSCYKNFYEKWSKLTNLNSLHLNFYEINQSNSVTNFEFISPLLKKVPKLTSLYFASWSESLLKKKKFLDFNSLWQSLAHLNSSLKTLYLEAPAISLKNLSNICSTSTLEKLGISGAVIGDTELSDILSLFSKQPTPPNSPMKSNLEVDYLLVNDQTSLINLLNTLSHVRRNLKLSLEIDLRKITDQDLVQLTNELLPRLHKRNFLKLSFSNIPKMETGPLTELLTNISQYEISDCLKIVNQSGNILFLGKDTYINEIDLDEESENMEGEEDGFFGDPEGNEMEFDEIVNMQEGYLEMRDLPACAMIQEIGGNF